MAGIPCLVRPSILEDKDSFWGSRQLNIEHVAFKPFNILKVSFFLLRRIQMVRWPLNDCLTSNEGLTIADKHIFFKKQ